MKNLNLKISNYLGKLTRFNFSAVFIILFIVILGNQISLVVTESLKNGFYNSEIYSLVFLKTFRDISFIISLSFVISLALTLNKFSKNSELTVISTAGYSGLKLIKFLKTELSVIFIIVTIFNFFILPIINNGIESLRSEIKDRPEFIFFKEGVFQKFNNKDTTFFSASVNDIPNTDSQDLQDIFIYSESLDRIIKSKKGIKKTDNKDNKVYLELIDGNIYDNFSIGAIKTSSISKFDNFSILIHEKKSHSIVNMVKKPESMNIYELLDELDTSSLNELLYRFSISISLIFMTILSLLIVNKNPRSKYNLSTAYGLVIFLIYYNLIVFLKEKVIEMSDLIVNFLVPHVIIYSIVLIIFFYQNNFSLKR